jgi:hypothetical protein
MAWVPPGMRTIIQLAIPFLLVAGAAAQSREGIAMRCIAPASPPQDREELIEPMSAEEAAQLHRAPHGAKRVGTHRLEVAWFGGKRIFDDTPPYDEPLDGVSWVYCGFESRVQMHLLLKTDRWLFTGALLDDRTGSLLPAGRVVVFSPDQKYYLAYEQPDGQDGETIKLFRTRAGLLWKGYNGILSADGKSVVAEFETVRWNDHDRLEADLKTPSGTDTVILTPGNGKWEWLSKVHN